MSESHEIDLAVPIDLEHLSQLPRRYQRQLIADTALTIENKIRAAKAIATENALSAMLEKGRHLELVSEVTQIQANLARNLLEFMHAEDQPSPEGQPLKKTAAGRMKFEQISAARIMKILKTSAEWLSELAKTEIPGEKGAIFAKNANFGSQAVFTGNVADDLARFGRAEKPEAAEEDHE